MGLLRLMFLASGLLLALISVPLMARRIPPNCLYGFRVQEALDDAVVWYAVNAYAGRRLFAAGLGAALTAVALSAVPRLSLDGYALACAGAVFIMLAAGFIQSLRYMGSLTRERRQLHSQEKK